jgi:DNA (cytosine-5)-methyltransferase 1
MLKIGSLCTGYGGLDMAVEEYFNAQTVWVSEIDKYASQVIELRLNKPNLGDLKKIDWANVEPIDILTAGYPCQPFSQAGNRKGTDDARHIWPDIKQGISILRPSYVILENVRGHLSLGFKEVLKDLAEIGYDAKWQIVRASDVGAPHRRERLFVVAQPSNTDGERSIFRESSEEWNQGQSQSQLVRSREVVANALGQRCENKLCCEESNESEQSVIANTDRNEQSRDGQTQELGRRFNSRNQMRLQRAANPLDITDRLNPQFVEYMMGLPEGWVTDAGLSRTQQLKMLGNGVVPQQALFALSQIMR